MVGRTITAAQCHAQTALPRTKKGTCNSSWVSARLLFFQTMEGHLQLGMLARPLTAQTTFLAGEARQPARCSIHLKHVKKPISSFRSARQHERETTTTEERVQPVEPEEECPSVQVSMCYPPARGVGDLQVVFGRPASLLLLPGNCSQSQSLRSTSQEADCTRLDNVQGNEGKRKETPIYLRRGGGQSWKPVPDCRSQTNLKSSISP